MNSITAERMPRRRIWGLLLGRILPTAQFAKAMSQLQKNYLSEAELAALNRIVSMYLDYAEDQAANRKPMHMVDWAKKLDGFLQFNEKNILMQAGKISHQMAQEHSEKELAKYEEQLRLVEATEPFSDFDKLVVEKLKELSPSRKEILPRSESKAQAVRIGTKQKKR